MITMERRARTLQHTYRHRGGASQLFKSKDSEVLISGPLGTGKSRAALEKLLVACLNKPGIRCLIVRKTATSLATSALDTWRKVVAKEALEAGHCEYYSGSAVEPAQYRFTNGSTVIVGGMDKSTRILSTEYDLIFAQEAIELKEEDWQTLLGRLRNGVLSFQQLIGDCNPTTPHHWLYKRCQEGHTKLFLSRHQDNPRYYDDDGFLTAEGIAYMAKLDHMTGVHRKRYRDGLWVAAEGVVYEDYNDATHVLDTDQMLAFGFRKVDKGLEPPANWNKYASVDFGFNNPFVFGWWAEDPDGRLYLYREIYYTRRLVEDHARNILPYGVPRVIVADHDAEDRETLHRHLGRSTTAAIKTVSRGIQATQERFKVQGDGRPRIYFYRHALVERDNSLADAGKPTCTIEELPGYVWNPEKDAPVKDDDHGMDQMRYVVMHRENLRTGSFWVPGRTGQTQREDRLRRALESATAASNGRAL